MLCVCHDGLVLMCTHIHSHMTAVLVRNRVHACTGLFDDICEQAVWVGVAGSPGIINVGRRRKGKNQLNG